MFFWSQPWRVEVCCWSCGKGDGKGRWAPFPKRCDFEWCAKTGRSFKCFMDEAGWKGSGKGRFFFFVRKVFVKLEWSMIKPDPVLEWILKSVLGKDVYTCFNASLLPGTWVPISMPNKWTSCNRARELQKNIPQYWNDGVWDVDNLEPWWRTGPVVEWRKGGSN